MSIVKKILSSFAILALVLASSCTDLSEIEEDIRNLQLSLADLENRAAMLNDNIVALQEFAQGATVTEVKEGAEYYVVTLSDGTELKLAYGKSGGEKAPILKIDEDGYWIVSYDNGETFEQMTDPQGQALKALGADGETPKFKIDTDKYWMVSYDEGVTFTYLLDDNGQKISAAGVAGGSNSLFNAVEVLDGSLKLTLADGCIVEVPIDANFKCILKDVSSENNVFKFSEPRSFEVELLGIQDLVIVPVSGWSATLENGVLTVTPPAVASEGVISIIANSTKGHTLITKLKVQAMDPADFPPLAPSLTLGQVTYHSIEMSVALENATGFKYLVKTQGSPAPQAVDFADLAIETNPKVLVQTLGQHVPYTIYVVAVREDKQSEPAALNATTTALNPGNTARDYLLDGYEIQGKTFDLTSENVYVLTGEEGSTTISKPGVYFIDPLVSGAEFYTPETTEMASVPASEMVIISRYEGTKVVLNGRAQLTVGPNPQGVGRGLVMKNIIYKPSKYFGFAGSAGTVDFFVLDGCEIDLTLNKLPLGFFDGVDKGIRSLILRGNKIKAHTSLLNIKNIKASEGRQVILDNNIIYAPAYLNAYVIAYNMMGFTEDDGTSANLEVEITHNSLINIAQFQSYGTFRFGGAKSLRMDKNIFFTTLEDEKSKYLLDFQFMSTQPAIFTYQDNKAYSKNPAKGWSYAFWKSKLKLSGEFANESADPFEGGTYDIEQGVFIPSSSYTGYGATLSE